MILQGTMQDGTVLPVQVDAQGRLVAEGLQGPPGQGISLPPNPGVGDLLGWDGAQLVWVSQGSQPPGGGGGGGGGDNTLVENVFQENTFIGSGSEKTITNGLNLTGDGGLVWIKNMVRSQPHTLWDTERGASRYLQSTAANGENVDYAGIETFNANGWTQGSGVQGSNGLGDEIMSWSFKRAPKFFDVVKVQISSQLDNERRIAHSLGVAPGLIIAKRIDGTSGWFVYHRSIGIAKRANLNNTDEFLDGSAVWSSTPPDDQTFGITESFFAPGGSQYVFYLFAHDPAGVVRCGSFNQQGNNGALQVDLGWEPQWVLFKSTTQKRSWHIQTAALGLAATGDGRSIAPNEIGPVSSLGSGALVSNETGFRPGADLPGDVYVYVAIRKGPMHRLYLGLK